MQVKRRMISEKCVRAVFSSGLEMSALSVRPAGLQAAALLDNRALRVRGVTTLESVRRNLFGCTDREENRRYVERDLARQLEIDSQRWGFDFAKEQPLPGAQRFAWQLVPASAIPAALRRSPVTMPQPSKPQEMKVSSPESSSKTQKRITDFLKPRKRLSTSVKKSPSNAHKHDLRPPKMPRLAQTHLKRTS